MSAAARKRRQREREALPDPVIVAPVEVPQSLIATLIDLGWLLERESEDRAQIGQAIAAALKDMSRVDIQAAHDVASSRT